MAAAPYNSESPAGVCRGRSAAPAPAIPSGAGPRPVARSRRAPLDALAQDCRDGAESKAGVEDAPQSRTRVGSVAATSSRVRPGLPAQCQGARMDAHRAQVPAAASVLVSSSPGQRERRKAGAGTTASQGRQQLPDPAQPASPSPGVVWKRGVEWRGFLCISGKVKQWRQGGGVCTLGRAPLSAAGHFDHGPLAPAHPHLPRWRVLAVGGMPSSSIPEAFSKLQQKALLI